MSWFHLFPDRKWLPYYIKAFGCTFYVMLEIARPHFWAWVWVQCPKAELTEQFNFTSTLKFQSSKVTFQRLRWQISSHGSRNFNWLHLTTSFPALSFQNISVEWKGPVFPVRVKGSAIMRDGLCYGGPEAMIQHFEQDGEINLWVNIERVPGGSDWSDGSDCGGSRMILHPSESEMLAIRDMERERNFSQLIIAASNQMIRRSTASSAINQPNRSPSRRSGSAKSKMSYRPSD